MSNFFRDTFWPNIDDHGVDKIFHLGDVFDRRKYVNFLTIQSFREDFINPLLDRDIFCEMIVGNHDTYFKDTNKINSLEQIFGERYHQSLSINYEPYEVSIDDNLSVLMMPWICEENYEKSFDLLKNSTSQIVMGHFEISGFDMYRGHKNEGGISPKLFDRFDQVFSGHFHHKSTKGNISYLGAPYEMTWSDYGDPRGFHIFDTETRELEFIQNEFPNFAKIWYNDETLTAEDVQSLDFSILEDTFVKVIIQNKNNPALFDLYMKTIEDIKPTDIQVVEDHLQQDEILSEALIDEAQDTQTIISNYVQSIQIKSDKDKVKDLMIELYKEAESI